MTSLHTISDGELLLFHYKDELAPGRISEIEDALFQSPKLRARYESLQRLLASVDAVPAALPGDGFEQTLWQALEPRIDQMQRERKPQQARRSLQSRWSLVMAALAWPRSAFAAAGVVAVAVGFGFLAGRHSATEGLPDAVAAAAEPAVAGTAAATRVLDAYVASHLRDTETLLLTAANSENAEIHSGNGDLAVALIDSNRLYALAAARAGDLRLADFLRRLEPVLLGVANQSPDSAIQDSEGLREYLRKTDLLFQVRATKAQLQSPSPRFTRIPTGASA